jgi:hypothetical protein
VYLGYKYKNLPILYYKYDEDNNKNIHGLNKDQDIIRMIKELTNGMKNKLNLFVDHGMLEYVNILYQTNMRSGNK